MKIREVVFNNFRSLRGEHRISFVNPVTQEVNPVTVLAGSNGSGKTTVLCAIEDLLAFVLEPGSPSELLTEAMAESFIGMELELSAQDLGESVPQQLEAKADQRPNEILYIAVGNLGLAPDNFDEHKQHLVYRLYETVERKDRGERIRRPWGKSPKYAKFASRGTKLRNAVSQMHKGVSPLAGGLLFFPHDRRLEVARGGPIEPPPEERQWRFHLSANNRWQGSLEQLWVWQNYLDLEQGSKETDHLTRFLASVQGIFGKERTIFVKEGRVWVVPAYWQSVQEDGSDPLLEFSPSDFPLSELTVLDARVYSPRVRLDQLPSGEQQVLLLFGELARRRRPGAVIAVDEIENSLHPTLQRLVMWNLRQIAREWDAQVIATTHSLEIIHSVRGSAFVNLDYPNDRFDLPIPDTQTEME